MKTSVLFLCTTLVPVGLSFGQMPVTDVDVKAEMIKANTNLESIDELLNTISSDVAKQLQIAEQDNQSIDEIKQGVKDTVERLDSLLERIGDPKTVDISKIDDLLERVADAKSGGLQELPDDVEEPDDAFFSEDGGGIIKPLGTTFKYQPPAGGDEREEDRVPSRYIGESEQLKSIQRYYTVRESAVVRRGQLLDLLTDVLEDMQDNKDDFAHLAKQTALVEVIQGQLQVCGDDINNAFNDVAVKGLHVYTLNAMRSKGDSEFAEVEKQEREEAMEDILEQINGGGSLVPSSGGGSSAGVTGGFLPWTSFR